MTKDLDTLLDECIDRMNEGESLEECLAGYPEHAKELGPLLRAVRNVHDVCSVVPGATATSAARQRLDAALVSSERALQKHQWKPWPLSDWSKAWTKIREEIDIKLRRQRWGIVVTAAALIILALAAYQLFLPGPRVMTYLTMQVNPALQLSLDREHKVIGVEGLDEDGEVLVAQMDIQNKGLQQALQEITDALMAGGFLGPERRIVIVLHPIDEREEENLPDLSAIAHRAVADRLVEMNVQFKVVIQVITKDLYETAIGKGLLPASYVDLIGVAVSEDSIKSIIELGNQLGIEQELFLKEFDTIASAMIDMVEAGITEAAAIDVLREAMKADPNLEKVATIVADVIDLVEEGMSEADALDKVKAAIGIDPEQEPQEELQDEPVVDPEQEPQEELEAEVGPAAATQILDMQTELGLDPALFKEELSTIAASFTDMVEAGITVENALSILRSSLAADPTLEELTTITAAMIDLHEVGASQDDIMATFTLLEEQIAAGVKRDLVLEEFSTIVSAQIDMLDAGISASVALAVLAEAMIADPKLEELTTITSAMIDLVVDEGISAEVALRRIEDAIKADPTLDNLDDLLAKQEADPTTDTGSDDNGTGNGTGNGSNNGSGNGNNNGSDNGNNNGSDNGAED